MDQSLTKARTRTESDKEMSGWASLLARNIERLKQAQDGLYDLAIGGTAVGTGKAESVSPIKYIFCSLSQNSPFKMTRAGAVARRINQTPTLPTSVPNLPPKNRPNPQKRFPSKKGARNRFVFIPWLVRI